VSAGGLCQLDRRGTHAAGATADQHSLAKLQVCLREERVMGRGEGLWQTTGLRPIERGRNRHELALMNDAKLSLGAAANNSHHAVAVIEPLGARASHNNLASKFKTGDVDR
jgi:hypothetical protein